MLVLTRQKGQNVVLLVGGTKVEVSLLDIRGDKVRVGFKAPGHVEVYREEVFERIRQENIAAAGFAAEVEVEELG
jgi:carbon storage regulator